MTNDQEYDYDEKMINYRPSRADSLAELIPIIRRHRYIIGEQSVTAISAFLYGFLFACAPDQAQAGNKELSNFNAWVHRYFDSKSTDGWFRIIADEEPDLAKSVSLFWKLWDEYKSDK